MDKLEEIKKYSLEQKEERSKEEVFEKIDIPEEEWRLLKIIAQRVGGDFGMEIKIGKPGEGSFFDTQNCSITLDPLHIKNNPEKVKFIAGHEGAHRAITPGPKEIGLSEEETEKLYSQIGFGYLQNVIEDTAVNDWLVKRFPGLELYMKKFYDEALKEENEVLVTPEIKRFFFQLGYWPKFVRYGSEVIRDWYQKRFSKNLDPVVEKALQRTINYVRESTNTIPDPQRVSRSKEEIIDVAQKRFENNTNYIWPEVKKLVEMDLHIEEQRQMIEDFWRKQKELEIKRKELEQAKKEEDKEKQEKLQEEIEKLEKELNPLNKLPEDVKKELEKKISEAIRKAIEKLNEEYIEKQKKLKKIKQKQEELKKQIESLKEKSKSAQGKEKEELKKQIQEKEIEKLIKEKEQKQIEEELSDFPFLPRKGKEREEGGEEGKEGKEGEERKEGKGEGEGEGEGEDSTIPPREGQGDFPIPPREGQGDFPIPLPIDELSDETKEELEKLFKELPSSKKKEYREKAKEKLEDLEDLINKEIEGKLNEDKPESHKKRKDREKAEREAALKSQEARIEEERIKKELEKIRKEKMTPYERVRAEVVGLIDDLYYKLRRILKPEEYGEEETAYPSGQYLDISRTMQAEKDVEQKYKLWIRENAPGKKDYRFWHLVDLSGSMQGKKIEETFKGFIIAGEAIDRLENLNSDTITIHQGITGFHNRIFPFKEPNERFTKEIEDKLSTMPERTSDDDAGTNTYEATRFALEELKQTCGETANFLLTFSDGEPNYDIRNKLKELLKQGKEEREKLKIKIGLIWLGEEEDEQKLQKLIEEYGYDFGLVMPAIKTEKSKTFSEALANLLEDIIKNSEKYIK